MAQKSVVVNSKLDHKFAAYVFLVIIFCWILCFLVVSGMAENAGADLNNFWENCVYSVLQYLIFIVAFFVVCGQLKYKGREIPRAIDLNMRVSFGNLFKVLIVAGLVLVSFMLLIEGISEVCYNFGVFKEDTGGLGIDTPSKYIMVVFVMCLLPAIVEELLFRGLIFKGLQTFGSVIAVFASAFLFSIFHLNPEQTIYQFVLGIVYAVILLKTGNLLYCMILHFLNNFAVVTTYTLFGDPATSLVWNVSTVIVAVGLAVLGTLILVGVIKTISQNGAEKNNEKKAKFFSFDNIGFFVATSLAVCIWAMMLPA